MLESKAAVDQGQKNENGALEGRAQKGKFERHIDRVYFPSALQIAHIAHITPLDLDCTHSTQPGGSARAYILIGCLSEVAWGMCPTARLWWTWWTCWTCWTG